MAYIIGGNVNDGSAVSREFEPEIDRVVKASLNGLDTVPADILAQVPRKLRIGPPLRGEGGVPDIISWSIGPFVLSPRVQQMLEELEPGVHKYIPLEFISEQAIEGQTAHGIFYLLHSVPVVDAINIDKTHFARGYGRAGYEAGKDGVGGISSNPDNACVVFADRIQGHHLWRLPRFPGDRKYMCSKVLWSRIKAAGCRGWAARKKCAE